MLSVVTHISNHTIYLLLLAQTDETVNKIKMLPSEDTWQTHTHYADS